MTEKRGRRRYWRRRPRHKEGEVSPGAASTEPRPETPAGDEGGSAYGEPPAYGEAPGPVEFAAAEAPADAEPHAMTEAPEGESAAAVPAVHEKGRRRRSRRRGRGAKGGAAEAPPVEPGGTAETPEPPTEVVIVPAEEAPLGAEGPPPAEGAEAPEAPPAAEAAGAPKKRRRRSRRRGRGQRGGAPVLPPEAEPPAAAVPETEEGGFAEGTLSEEAAERPEGEELPETAEEETEEVSAARGPRKVMLIDGLHPEEIRVAFATEGTLEYFEVENQRRKQFKGNIYKGRVVNVAPAIEAAFVEFGGGRHGFLPLNEYCGGALMENLGTWHEGDKRPHLRPGTEILVQVTKEESSVKGAALTSYISIAGRYLVMMLGMKRYGISKKITGEKERERIRKNMEKLDYPEHLGFIVRTVGAGEPLKNLKADLENLLKLWDRTVEGARTHKAPALLYEEQDIVIRTLRDNYSSEVAEVLMNSPDSFRKAQAFFDVYYPKQTAKLKLLRQKRPLFAKFNLEEQIERATARKVPLPSGGHIVIDRTEAMWSIDVNSGRSSKDRDIEDTAYRTNKEAAVEVGRQLRIRDMGGLIVVDFIDMENRSHIKDVEKTIKEMLKKDKAKSDVSSMGKFGLVAMSRQRMGISFYEVMTKGCETCGGTGLLPTADAVMVRLLRRIHAELSKENTKELSVGVAPSLLESLLNQKRDEITAMEKMCGARVAFHADPAIPAGSFTVGEGT